MHITEISILISVNSHINAVKHMHDLTVIPKNASDTNSALEQDIDQDGNLHFYPHNPKSSPSAMPGMSGD